MRHDIDMYAVMQRIPEILGMELTWKNGSWLGRYYLSGERHPYRRDKLKIKFWKYNGRNYIMLYEQGGDAMSLENWLQQYGGCPDKRSAREIMRGCKPCAIELGVRSRSEGEIKYVGRDVLDEYRRYELEGSMLFNWMCRMFGESKVREAFERYNVTADSEGRTVFWYVDPEGRVCHDKIFKYGINGRRDKHFISRRFKVGDGYRGKCFFGSHLMGVGEPVNVCESEKSALLGYLEYGGIWIACGGKGNLRDVTPEMLLFPDIDAISEWGALEGANIVEWWEDADVEIGDTDDIGDMIVKRRLKNYYPNRYI